MQETPKEDTRELECTQGSRSIYYSSDNRIESYQGQESHVRRMPIMYISQLYEELTDQYCQWNQIVTQLKQDPQVRNRRPPQLELRDVE